MASDLERANSVLTWEQGEGDRVDAILLGGSCALRVGDIHLEFDRLLEDCRARCGLVLCSETCLRDHAVAQAGDLAGGRGRRVSKGKMDKEAEIGIKIGSKKRRVMGLYIGGIDV